MTTIGAVSKHRTVGPADDLPDPGAILAALPDRERENFLAHYRQALETARDPAQSEQLARVLRRWHGMALIAARPGFYQAQESALAGAAAGCLLAEILGRMPDRRQAAVAAAFRDFAAAAGEVPDSQWPDLAPAVADPAAAPSAASRPRSGNSSAEPA